MPPILCLWMSGAWWWDSCLDCIQCQTWKRDLLFEQIENFNALKKVDLDVFLDTLWRFDWASGSSISSAAVCPPLSSAIALLLDMFDEQSMVAHMQAKVVCVKHLCQHGMAQASQSQKCVLCVLKLGLSIVDLTGCHNWQRNSSFSWIL